MIYLSRLYLNPRSRAVQRDAADCHQLHRTVLCAFPAAPKGLPVREAFGVLYRLETGLTRRGIQLLVQSKVEPSWSHLPAGYLTPGAGVTCKAVDQVYDALQADRVLLFRLNANPTRKIHPSDDTAKRVELRTEEQQLSWLRRKGDEGGFALLSVKATGGPAGGGAAGVPNVRTIPREKVTGRRDDGRGLGTRQLTFGSVAFEGLLRVTDPGRFRETLARGVGSGKAYGFGLLSIASPPAPD
jgi:CRISPR system Cascade subunit CasE